MAVNQKPQPDVNALFDDTAQFGVLQDNVTFAAGGYAAVEITGTGSLVLKAGSRFEMNGLLYVSQTDTAVSGTVPDGGDVRYVMCGSSTLALSLSAAAPAFNAAKAGWYSGSDRAIARARLLNGTMRFLPLVSHADFWFDFEFMEAA